MDHEEKGEHKEDVDGVDDEMDIANIEEDKGVVLGEKAKEAETNRRPGTGDRGIGQDEAGVGMLYPRKSSNVKDRGGRYSCGASGVE